MARVSIQLSCCSACPCLCSWLTVLKRLAFGRDGAGGVSNVGMGLFDEEPFASTPGACQLIPHMSLRRNRIAFFHIERLWLM